MTASDEKISHVAIRLRSRQPVTTAEIEDAAILARRSKLKKTGAALEEELAWRRTTGTSVVGSVVLSKKEQDRLYRNLTQIRLTIAEAAARAGQDAKSAAGKVAGGLVVIGLGIFGAASIRRRVA
jgi:hypothetical protein